MKVNTKEYMQAVREAVNSGKTVAVTVTGASMSPFLVHRRDTVYLEKLSSPVRRGDILLYTRRDGQYVLHRVKRARGDSMDMIGDAQTFIERGVPAGSTVARVTSALRKGRECAPGSFWWWFFRGPWLLFIPLRPLMIRTYAFLRRL